MNIKKLSLGEITTPPKLLKETMNAIIHTIIFNRGDLTGVTPQDVSFSGLDNFFYTRTNNSNVIKNVTNEVENFYSLWEKKSFVPESQTILISISDEQPKQGFFGFSKTIESIKWEQWSFNIKVTTTEISLEDFKNSLTEMILLIIQFLNQSKDHIPPLKKTNTFSFQISFPSIQNEAGILSGLFWN